MQTERWSPPREPGPWPPLTGRARRRWVPVGLIAVLALLLLGFGLFLANYDPLCHEVCTGVSGVHGSTVTRLGEFVAPNGETFTAYRSQHVPGRKFSFWVTLSNQGPWGVTIIGVGSRALRFDPLAVERVQIQPETGNPHLRAFRPFSLAPHDREFVDVLVTMRMRGCLGEGSQTTIGSVPVTFRVLGITRHTTVFLPDSITLVGRRGVHCSP